MVGYFLFDWFCNSMLVYGSILSAVCCCGCARFGELVELIVCGLWVLDIWCLGLL